MKHAPGLADQQSVVRVETGGGIALVSLNAPPLNLLGRAMRRELHTTLALLASNRAVRAVILRGVGRGFSAGLDLAEDAGPADEGVTAEGGPAPEVAALCAQIENFPKPVVALLQGPVLGAGLDLALAAHARVAELRAQMAFPEITLWRMPCGGATQRLPRLIGAGPALDMLLGGKPVASARAEAMGLVSQTVDGDPISAAREIAETLAARPAGLRRTCDRDEGFSDPGAYWAALRRHREAVNRMPVPSPVARALVRCVEAAQMMSFDQGLALERTLAGELEGIPERAASRHVFFAERKAAIAPGDRVPARPIESVGVLGAGPTGVALARICAAKGFRVHLSDRSAALVRQGMESLTADLDAEVARGALGLRQRGQILERIGSGADMVPLENVDLLLEALPDDFDIKSEAFYKLGQIARPGALIATTGAWFEIDAFAQKTGRPENTIGLHFPAPVLERGLVEVVPGTDTVPDAVATGFALARWLGRWPVLSSGSEGLISGRLRAAYWGAADLLMEDGANPAEVDGAMRDFGFPMGPFEEQDLEGLDRAWGRRRRAAATRDPEDRYVEIADQICAQGWFGRKTGRGYYRYPEGGKVGLECPEVAALIDAEREAKGIAARPIAGEEIQERCLLALINEGARLLGEQIAGQPAEIDSVAVHGLGFPRWRGGPLYQADKAGIEAVAQALDDMAPEAPAFWSPAALVLRLADEGHGFFAARD